LRAAAGAEADADDCARAASCSLPACVAKVSRAYIVAEHIYTQRTMRCTVKGM
jgi:hypothetical protein